MTALDGWIDVCRTGTWRDARGRNVEVTDATLDGLVAAHAGQDPVPVVVGHPAIDAPAYAYVDAVRKTGDRLQAKLRDIMPEFREAVEAGRYAGRSIAINKDGGLRHLGFLGGHPPAVPGLAPTQFSAEPDQVIEFAADGEERLWQIRGGWMAMARMARSWRDSLIADKGIEEADKVIPGWEVESVERAAEAARVTDTGFAGPDDTTQTAGSENDNKETDMDETELAARQADLDAREAALKDREKAAAAQARLAAADTALAAHVEAGRVLPAERAALASLLASLPEDDTTIAFAAADGEIQKKPRQVLEDFLAALPKRVPYGELAGGTPPAPADTGVSTATIAAEAQALLAKDKESGGTLTAVEAVDIVRKKHGLDTGSAS